MNEWTSAASRDPKETKIVIESGIFIGTIFSLYGVEVIFKSFHFYFSVWEHSW